MHTSATWKTHRPTSGSLVPIPSATQSKPSLQVAGKFGISDQCDLGPLRLNQSNPRLLYTLPGHRAGPWWKQKFGEKRWKEGRRDTPPQEFMVFFSCFLGIVSSALLDFLLHYADCISSITSISDKDGGATATQPPRHLYAISGE